MSDRGGTTRAALFSPSRLWAVVLKEFIQMRRDRMTLAMMVGIPIIQLILFGYAINSDPKNLPTLVLGADNSRFSRSLVAAMQNSAYFDLIPETKTRAQADAMLEKGELQFVLTIPDGFHRQLIRGERPVLLLEADATDPAATSNAVAAFRETVERAFAPDLKGVLSYLATKESAVALRFHARYNPEAITQYNIVPGLMGVILTLTMVIITGLAITRERERGTMENLLSLPVRPLEVMVGKIIPYILVGYVQVVLIMVAARFLFQVPFHGNLALVFVIAGLFIAANLSVGVTFSTIATNQLQAMQLSIFFFLPSILLSGFMFPFRGMPVWAQTIGEVLPLTHFLRIVRGILLKGNGIAQIWPELWPISLFLFMVLLIGVLRYRQTLD